MKGWTFFWGEVRNIVKSRQVIVPLLGLLVIPLLYCGIYLIANWDPYGNIKHLPVAVVNEDQPVDFQGNRIAVGEELVKKLGEKDTVNFQFMTREDAEEGLDNHEYYLAIYIPEGMSDHATTIMDPSPKPMQLIYKENSSFNFISAQIADKIVETIRGEVSTSLTETYVEQMFLALSNVADGLSQASDGAGQIEDGLNLLGEGIQQFKDTLNTQINEKVSKTPNQVDAYINKYGDVAKNTINGKIDSYIAEHSDAANAAIHEKLDRTINEHSNEAKQKINEAVAKGVRDKAKEVTNQNNLLSTLPPELQEQLKPYKEALDKRFMEVVTESITPRAQEEVQKQVEKQKPVLVNKAHEVTTNEFNRLKPILQDKAHQVVNENLPKEQAKVQEAADKQVQEVLKKVEDAQKAANAGFAQMQDGQKQLTDGSKELKEKLREGAEAATQDTTLETYKHFASPVEKDKAANNDVTTYGVGMAPYFLSLGLFVGAFMLSTVFPMKDPFSLPPSGGAWFSSKFGVMAIEGILQAVIVATFVIGYLKIEVTSIPMFYFLCIIASLMFFAMVQFFITVFGNVGRFIVILLLLFQLSSTAGTFPIELVPNFFQNLHPWLPMTYTIRGFRAIVSTGDMTYIWENVAVICTFMSVCLAGSYMYFRIQFKKLANIK
ncbi:YhgE/Pip domain-containing protein [Priestia taiwanensis]|uniref:Phage infection protein n=1 Tax=Priestia taiwanensis TaxID=1347902 RepID=A0A917AX50_9BACI|nr:YhgE/Pip domain-containing protein [Priestia taiwanensis]MBM7364737.1 putative membrane protein [Priestia taiwanensis]GGE79238.1 phage infection protein [Priestia taiwanensis]